MTYGVDLITDWGPVPELVRFPLDGGGSVLVEVDERDGGVRRIGRGEDGVIAASERMRTALETVKGAAAEAITVLAGLSPDALELEFGVKLSAEAGAVIAKTTGEGHFVVKLTWQDGRQGA